MHVSVTLDVEIGLSTYGIWRSGHIFCCKSTNCSLVSGFNYSAPAVSIQVRCDGALMVLSDCISLMCLLCMQQLLPGHESRFCNLSVLGSMLQSFTSPLSAESVLSITML